MRALVIFCDDNTHKLAWLLKPGFRHCFVCIESNGLWLQIDGGPGIPNIKYLSESDFDLATFYRDKGFTIVETFQRNKSVTFPLILRNCVGLTKGILCISGWALTPYELYRQLEKENAVTTRI